MKTYKQFESIRDKMTPKSEEDIKKYVMSKDPYRKLMDGAREDVLWLVEYAINNGANVLKWKNDALVIAADNGHTDIIKFLLDNGADIHHNEDWALRSASRAGYSETVKFLLDNGADVHAYVDQALSWACALGNDVETVKILLDYGADMYAYDSAAIKSAAESNDEIYDFLLNYGKN
jgi:ankyrin repeat protein